MRREAKPVSNLREIGIVLVACLFAIMVFVADLNIQLGVAGGVAYIFPLLVITFCSSYRYLFVAATICSFLILIGWLLSPPGSETWIVATNRGLALFVIWVTAVFASGYKRASANSAENEERYALAMAGTNDGIWDWNIITGEDYFSPRWSEILGYRENELEPHIDSFQELLHPDDRDRVIKAVKAHLDDRVRFDLQYRLRNKSGDYIWARARGQAVWDENGKPLRMAGSISDITEFRRVELEHRESESRLKALLDSTPFDEWFKDLDGRYLLVNKKYQENMELREEDFIGRTVDKFHPVELAESFLQGDQEAIDSREAVSFNVSVNQPGGTPGIRHVIKFPVINLDGDVLGVGGMAIDVTEQMRAEEKLQQAQKMEAVGQLTGGIAHEFNNLLMVVVGNLEMALNHISDSKAQRFVASAMKGALRGGELTRQLLAFSRKQDLRAEPVNLNVLTRDMQDMLQRILGETIVVSADLTGDIWPVLADKSSLESALLNLALNSRDAMPKGGEIVIATANRFIDAEQLAEHPDLATGDYVMLEVADTGSGIAPENLEHVFEPFFTTKDVGEGTGLGLSMIFGFAEQSGGFVEIESELGQGTKVRICLPRSTAHAAEPATETVLDGQVSALKATVLVVEDDPAVREIVVGILSDLGCDIIEAEDAKAALLQLERRDDINVLFTDVVLPGGVSGPDLVIEARRILPDIKIVLTSGYPDGDITGLNSGEENPWFIRKPYRRNELAELLGKVVLS